MKWIRTIDKLPTKEGYFVGLDEYGVPRILQLRNGNICDSKFVSHQSMSRANLINRMLYWMELPDEPLD